MSVLVTPASLIDSSRQWSDALEARIFRELGVTATIFPVGAPRRSNALLTATTFTTRRDTASGLEATATCRVTATATAPYSWATPFDLTIPTNWKGIIPILTFNGTSNNIDTPDAAYWTSALAAFTAGFWVKFSVVNAIQDLLTKYDVATGAEACEFRMYLDADGKLNIEVWDETANAVIGIKYNTALVAGTWYHIVFTYGGGTDNTSCKIYLNGVSVGDTSLDSGVFVTMQNTATLVRIGSSLGTDGARTGYFNGQMAMGLLGPGYAQVAIAAAPVKNLYLCGADALGL